MKYILKKFFNIFLPLIVGIYTVSISLFILQPIMAKKYQVYYDIILEYVAIEGTNKDGELFSFWISMFVGIFSMLLFKVFWDKYTNRKNELYTSKNIDVKLSFLGAGLIFVPALFNIIVKQEVNFFLLTIGVIYYVYYLFRNKKDLKIDKVILLIFVIYFFLLSVKAILDKVFPSIEILNEENTYFLLVLFFIIIVFYLKKINFKNFKKVILLFQIPIPLVLLTFLTERYSLKNEIYYIFYTKRYKSLIITIIILLIISNIIQYRKKIHKEEKVLVMLSSVIIVFILHYYIAPAYMTNGDFWHNGEEMIQWHQIIDKKLQLYKEFSGTSGLYGMVSGFFQNKILQGTDLSFFSAKALTNIFWSSSIAILCYYLVGGYFSLALGLFIGIPYYNRPIMMFFSLLILLLPKLIKSRVRWIQVYIILSIFSLFYYPLNGVALILGVFPFCLIQLYSICKEKLLRKEVKNVKFWLINILIIFMLLKMFKIFMGLIEHMLLLSSQSKLADGITLDNSKPSIWFMKFFNNREFVNTMWHMFIFTVIISCVLIFIYFIYIYLKSKNKQELLLKLESQGFLILSAGCIAIPINYTYTVIRMDWSGEFARTASTMVIFIGFLLNIFLYNYGDKLLTKNIKIISIGLCIGFACMIQDVSFGKELKTIQREYVFSDNFEYVDGDDINIPKLGKGFISSENIRYIITMNEIINKTVEKDESFWTASNREFIYMFDSKTPTKIDSMRLTKSLKSTNENLKSIINDPPPLIIDTLTYESYYVYRWILESEYIFFTYNGVNFWVRPDIYEETFGNLEEAYQKMFDEFPQQQLYKIPYSLGNSMITLNRIFNNEKIININDLEIDLNQMEKINGNKFKILETKDPFIIITLPEVLLGKDYDFIYLEVSANQENKEIKDKKVQLYFEGDMFDMNENRSVRFDYGNGKFLIPVGVIPAWNFADIKKIRIDFDEFELGDNFEIKNIYFLKLDTKRNVK